MVVGILAVARYREIAGGLRSARKPIPSGGGGAGKDGLRRWVPRWLKGFSQLVDKGPKATFRGMGVSEYGRGIDT
jgi:hypothetical protein